MRVLRLHIHSLFKVRLESSGCVPRLSCLLSSVLIIESGKYRVLFSFLKGTIARSSLGQSNPAILRSVGIVHAWRPGSK